MLQFIFSLICSWGKIADNSVRLFQQFYFSMRPLVYFILKVEASIQEVNAGPYFPWYSVSELSPEETKPAAQRIINPPWT